MSTMYKVYDNVPLPQINRAPQGRFRKYPLETMKVGQMFFVPNRAVRSVTAYISRISKDVPGKFSVRTCWMVQDSNGDWQLCEPGSPPAVEGAGVWRIE